MKHVNWKFLLLRLSEAGSYRAIAVFLGALGVQIPDPTWQKIVLAGTGLAGLVSILIPELASPVATDVGAGVAPIQQPPISGIPVSLSGEKP